MITMIFVLIAYFMASKGKRSAVMMSVYTAILVLLYFLLVMGLVGIGKTESIPFYLIDLTLQLFLSIITVYGTDKKIEKIRQEKVLIPMVANFKLMEERINNKLTQKQVAGIIGINEKQYEKYEIGKTDIPVSVVIQLARLYKVSIDHLLGMEIQEVQKTAPGSEQN